MINNIGKSNYSEDRKELPEAVRTAVKNIDRNNPLPLYQQLFDALYKVIIDKNLEQGSFFATESLLLRETQMSRSTIRKALEELVRQKYLIRITGKGTFVSIDVPKVAIDLPRLKSMSQELTEKGMEPGSIILQAKKIKPHQEIAEKLHLNPSDDVLFIERIRTGNKIPILYIRGYIPFNIVEHTDLNNIPNSLYQLIKDCGRTVHSAIHVINASIMPTKVAKLLGVEKSTAGLAIERTTFDTQQVPVIYEEGIFRSDLFNYTLKMQDITL
ncbi:GntR family transcriptional regulator [Oceanobacillus alkalisoli]|uniref:GntR family transcriptional regulator n=1 Tax=Oceanobacillus alkalisoli TaxID=2925113 RepID=UPI001EF156CE|nr:GntR family transcriptional regulator [Oceanobacillus alkalisoli]MCF3944105.1 GntR family transcriptional regulator [Oceanobacillus alkalisoli]MCG5102512.1 GntR family transcriptional regulator [Oceanobacillus alkalisoli]